LLSARKTLYEDRDYPHLCPVIVVIDCDDRLDSLLNEPDTGFLSIKYEKRIAGHLAFLAATRKDSDKVMAACLQQDSDGKSVTFRLASNSGDLSLIEGGFNMLGRALERVAQCSKHFTSLGMCLRLLILLVESQESHDVQAVLDVIAELDMSRILTRLRSRHAPKSKKQKPPLTSQLRAALLDPASLSYHPLMDNARRTTDILCA
jgi:hypothetical protein